MLNPKSPNPYEEVACLRAESERLRRELDTAVRRAEKLAELDRLKSDLFADVSHEFRTPLTLILGPLMDLEAGYCGELPAEAHRQVELASRNAERLLWLVEQILDTARLDAGRLELRVRRGDLAELLADVAERFESLAERRRVRLGFEPTAEPTPMWYDPDQLEKVFSNLLSNALRYSPEGGRVEITVEPPAAGTVAVTVHNDGPHIAPLDQERIFDRFYRAPATAGGAVGTGLGLPLARRLAELHGGGLTLESAPGEGCTFRVELRLGRDHFTPSQVVDDRPSAGTGFGRRQPEPGQNARLPWGQKVPAVVDFADRTTVLVVDDHPGIRAFVRRHLEPRCRVEEAGDGAEGLALARDLLPDLVISDVMMPNMDGYALCRALKEDPELDWVPVILLTARAAADDKLEGLGGGADDYLTKPFEVRELVARVDNLITSRRRLRERSTNGGPRSRLPLAPGVRPTPADREWLERVRSAVEAGFNDERFSVGKLAAKLAVHRSRLHERLRELTGMPPVQLIGHLRLERAAALLRTAGASVSEVAYDVGFQSVAHFSRRFRERFGQSPSAWQRAAV